MERSSQKEAKQSKEEKKSEDAKSESDNENTVGVSTLNLEKELWPDDEDIGVDPYNTGRIDTENV